MAKLTAQQVSSHANQQKLCVMVPVNEKHSAVTMTRPIHVEVQRTGILAQGAAQKVWMRMICSIHATSSTAARDLWIRMLLNMLSQKTYR